MSIRKDRVRVIAFMKRKEGVSKEEFDRYWLEDHSKIFMSLEIVQQNLFKYEQAHRAQISENLEIGGIPIVEWDGMAIFEGESWAKIFQIFQSEEYIKGVIPDEEKFFDREQSKMFAADLATLIDK